MTATTAAPEIASVTGNTATFVKSKIAGNICAVYIHVRRPAARPQANDVDVEVPADDKAKGKVRPEQGQMTTPCWRIDINDRWRLLDANRREIESALDTYSVSTSIKGERLIPMSKVPECVQRLDALRTKRLEIADNMFVHWDEILTELRKRFPDVYETQIEPALPNPKELREKLDAFWVLKPLTPMGLEDFDLSAMDNSEAKRLIERNQQNIDKMFTDSYGAVLDGVFVELSEVCKGVVDDQTYWKGRKKNSPVLDNIFDLLEKARSFAEFTDNPAEITKRIETAREALKEHDIVGLRENPIMQEALRTAFEPLKNGLKGITEVTPGGRATRTLEV